MKHIASCSFGKDSLAMILKLIELKYPLDEVVFYDTGMEFKAIYNIRDKMIPILEENEIKYVELKPDRPFLYDMLEKPIYSKKNGHHNGYGWCGGACRWGTQFKNDVLDLYKNSLNDEIYAYIGIAADEQDRIKNKHYPLVEWKMTEKDCLEYCYSKGFYWEETDEITNQTFRLYDYLPRVSCWCCRNKNLDELRNYYHYMPMYFDKLKEMQSKLPNDPMKKQSGSVFDLEKRFRLEDEWIKNGLENKIRSKQFFEELKNKLN